MMRNRYGGSADVEAGPGNRAAPARVTPEDARKLPSDYDKALRRHAQGSSMAGRIQAFQDNLKTVIAPQAGLMLDNSAVLWILLGVITFGLMLYSLLAPTRAERVGLVVPSQSSSCFRCEDAQEAEGMLSVLQDSPGFMAAHIAVLSSCSRLSLRNALRSSWVGQMRNKGLSYTFFVAASGPSGSATGAAGGAGAAGECSAAALKEEAATYGDIIVGRLDQQVAAGGSPSSAGSAFSLDVDVGLPLTWPKVQLLQQRMEQQRQRQEGFTSGSKQQVQPALLNNWAGAGKLHMLPHFSLWVTEMASAAGKAGVSGSGSSSAGDGSDAASAAKVRLPLVISLDEVYTHPASLLSRLAMLHSSSPLSATTVRLLAQQLQRAGQPLLTGSSGSSSEQQQTQEQAQQQAQVDVQRLLGVALLGRFVDAAAKDPFMAMRSPVQPSLPPPPPTPFYEMQPLGLKRAGSISSSSTSSGASASEAQFALPFSIVPRHSGEAPLRIAGGFTILSPAAVSFVASTAAVLDCSSYTSWEQALPVWLAAADASRFNDAGILLATGDAVRPRSPLYAPLTVPLNWVNSPLLEYSGGAKYHQQLQERLWRTDRPIVAVSKAASTSGSWVEGMWGVKSRASAYSASNGAGAVAAVGTSVKLPPALQQQLKQEQQVSEQLLQSGSGLSAMNSPAFALAQRLLRLHDRVMLEDGALLARCCESEKEKLQQQQQQGKQGQGSEGVQ